MSWKNCLLKSLPTHAANFKHFTTIYAFEKNTGQEVTFSKSASSLSWIVIQKSSAENLTVSSANEEIESFGRHFSKLFTYRIKINGLVKVNSIH